MWQKKKTNLTDKNQFLPFKVCIDWAEQQMKSIIVKKIWSK